MEHALGLHDEIDKNASATDDAVDVLMMSKPCKMKAPVDDGSGSSTSESTDVPQPISVKGDSTIHNMRSDHRGESPQKVKNVTIVHLQREQRGNLAILSSREKYNFAVSCFQPVITYLQN